MTTNNCNKYKYVVPDITPVIYSLSMYTSPEGSYANVYIYGKNFSVNSSVNSFIKFGNKYVYDFTYYDRNTISFFVERYITFGSYELKVVNVHNNSPYFSNGVTYVVTNVVTI